MPGEKKGYTPKEVLVSEGPDKGRIKDKELAEIGANAEDDSRRRLGNRLNRRFNPKNQDAYDDYEGTFAMKSEIQKRTQKDLETKGVSPAAVRRGSAEAVKTFEDKQADWEKDRKQKIVDEKEQKINDEVDANLRRDPS